ARARATGTPLDVGAVTAAGAQVLTDRGVTGQVTITDGVVRVTTSTTTRTVFLSLVGITTLSASGEATAVLER
ncbi:MAG TPA: pilus assembly protein, partial [Propionibacterium sp.]|nr:pilus assembly protein [Propionibacterium sp.]